MIKMFNSGMVSVQLGLVLSNIDIRVIYQWFEYKFRLWSIYDSLASDPTVVSLILPSCISCIQLC